MRNGRKSLRMYVFFRGATRMYHKWIEMHWIQPKWSKQGEWEKEKWHCDTNVEKQRGIHRNGGNLGKLSLKITEKVSFNIASEASYIYILSGQKFIKNAKIIKKLKNSNETFFSDF